MCHLPRAGRICHPACECSANNDPKQELSYFPRPDRAAEFGQIAGSQKKMTQQACMTGTQSSESPIEVLGLRDEKVLLRARTCACMAVDGVSSKPFSRLNSR